MESKICMNVSCGATATTKWRRGWPLRLGGLADLCEVCGSIYENGMFCKTFHSEETGWRQCLLCNKRLHCGCIASKFLLELLDYGGVECIECARSSALNPVRRDASAATATAAIHGKLNSSQDHSNEKPCGTEVRKTDAPVVGRMKLIPCRKIKLVREPASVSAPLKNGYTVSIKREESIIDPHKETCRDLTDPNQTSTFARPDTTARLPGIKDCSPPQSNLPWNSAMWCSSFLSPVPDYVGEENTKNATSPPPPPPPAPPPPPFHQHESDLSMSAVQCLPSTSDAVKTLVTQTRISRPPAEPRGRNQLLPRYWPRITDQELQQLSGESLNSMIVPLFEKVLSASDAGRIGRLVLPKACAEAYFPAISQSEGLPLKIQDVKGKEWTFQFRFWPNNNSRMYVLEGVTPCIQSLQLQAGDTVTFSRINPGGKLIMGFRKAASYGNTQDAQGYAASDVSGELSFPWDAEDVANSAMNTNCGNEKIVRNGGVKKAGNREKRARNISSKNKRLLMMNCEEVMELRVTWEEAQHLLRPPTSATPSIVLVEDQEFEEYDEPPVFGKRTVFISAPSGGQEQWAQCDSCSKWRRIPVEVLLPPKWTCSENVWDPKRSTCSASVQFKTKRMKSVEARGEREPEALVSVVVQGENSADEPNGGGVTTKHPRHRSGCSCIVCIQPPSGQGKHDPTCTCNVCMTVKRRFRTLMMRRKIRQSDGADPEPPSYAVEPSLDIDVLRGDHHVLPSSSSAFHSRIEAATVSSSSAIDLNCDPDHAVRAQPDGVDVGPTRGSSSMVSLVQAASLPLQMYMKQNGFAGPVRDQEPVAVDSIFLHSSNPVSQ